MKPTLSTSAIDRKNILNNSFAIEHIQEEVGIKGLQFEDKYILTVKQVALFFEVDERTIERYLSEHSTRI